MVVSAAAGSFESEAEALARTAFAMRARLAELGNAWGDDAVGARFGKRYEPAANTVLDNAESMALGLMRIGAALRAVAAAFVRGDEELIKPIPDGGVADPGVMISGPGDNRYRPPTGDTSTPLPMRKVPRLDPPEIHHDAPGITVPSVSAPNPASRAAQARNGAQPLVVGG